MAGCGASPYGATPEAERVSGCPPIESRAEARPGWAIGSEGVPGLPYTPRPYPNFPEKDPGDEAPNGEDPRWADPNGEDPNCADPN